MKKSIRRVETKSAPFWPINLLVILFLAVVCYWKLTPFRESVDAKIPWLKAQTSGYFPAPSAPLPIVAPTPAAPAPVVVVARQEAVAESTPAPLQAEATPTPAPAAPPNVADVQTLSEIPGDWPKKVKITRAMIFPAVTNGVIVGTVQVPVGSLVDLRMIKNGMLGLEYKGGGGWHKPDETDIMQQVQNAHRPPDTL